MWWRSSDALLPFADTGADTGAETGADARADEGDADGGAALSGVTTDSSSTTEAVDVGRTERAERAGMHVLLGDFPVDNRSVTSSIVNTGCVW
jgi:hypothetical protein